jgi:hypothetical protein
VRNFISEDWANTSHFLYVWTISNIHRHSSLFGTRWHRSLDGGMTMVLSVPFWHINAD